MNIRGISNMLNPFLVRKKERTAAESAPDRDPQQGGGGGQERKPPMTEVEIQAAIESIQQLPGFNENNLSIRIQKTDGMCVVFIEDPLGKVVRRIAEVELRSLNSDATSGGAKGRLFHRAL